MVSSDFSRKVVRLLGIQCEDLVGDVGFRDQQRDDGFRAETAHRLNTVIAIWCEIAAVLSNGTPGSSPRPRSRRCLPHA